jgi:3-polyprenyl-4-hydroxybenzoate decarboxylase
VEGDAYENDRDLASRTARAGKFDDWQVVVLLDDADAALSPETFLWATWTRFNPATDIFAKSTVVKDSHIGYEAPVVIDARKKPWHPKEVEPDAETVRLVDRRWDEYFRRAG